jgi:CubicO group peptidase (beta-lactamase class C family)
VRSSGLLRLLDALDADPVVDPHGLVLVRRGAVVAQGWWAPYSAPRPHLLYSLSKTFTAMAVGFAVAEGLCSLDDRVVDHFPEFADEVTGPRSRAMRLRDVLSMASGHHREMVEVARRADPREPVRGFLLAEPESDPGSWFQYNQPATYTAAAIVQRAAGTSLVEYLRPRLFDPLGIGPVSWQQYPPGRDIGFTGLHAPTEAVAALGQLLLQDGVWQGRQVLPVGWAEQVRQRRIATLREPNADWRLGYGFQVWMSRHGYRGDGAYGQFCLVLPEHDAVLAVNSATPDMQRALDLVWEHLVPAFTDGPLEPAAADGELAARLASLTLPPSRGGPVGSEWAGTYRGAGLTVTVAPRGSMSVADGRLVLEVPAPTPTWSVVEDGGPPVAVSGGVASGAVHLDLAFLETPHRLDLELRRPGGGRDGGGDGSVTASWRTVPLDLADRSPLQQSAPRPLG